ncbi:MAG: tryptophan synthase subunit beta, partial [Spirochaetota bacterium]
MNNNIDKRYFGSFGGRYIPEVLRPAFEELEQAFESSIKDPSFNKALDALYSDYVGRPTPLYYAENLTNHFGGAKIYFKMEALAHTGAHKINNAVGQALLAKRMG